MEKYVGIIERINEFCNFKPLGRISEREIDLLTTNERERLLPESNRLNINLSYSLYAPPEEVPWKLLSDRQIVLLEFDPEKLEANISPRGERNPTGYRLSYALVRGAGLLTSISRAGYRFIERAESLIDPASLFKSRIVEISPRNTHVGDEFFLDMGDRTYLGPYLLKKREIDGAFYFMPEIQKAKYTSTVYSNGDLKKFDIYEMEERWGETQEEVLATVVKIRSSARPARKDVITDAQLIEALRSSLSAPEITDGKLDLSEIGPILSHLDQSFLAGPPLTADIAASRKERIRNILLTEKDEHDNLSDLASTIASLLISKRDNGAVAAFVDSILDAKPDVLAHFQNSRIVLEKKRLLEQEVLELEERKSRLEAVPDPGQEGKAEKRSDSAREAEVSSRLSALLEKLGAAQELSSLREAAERSRSDYEAESARLLELKEMTEKAEASLNEVLDGYREKMMSVAFDGSISNALLKAASGWNEAKEEEKFAAARSCLMNIPAPRMEAGELIDHICRLVQYERPQYSRNTIVNILLCVCSGFLTVFSGDPGCGKTSICRILSKVLGLSSLARYGKELPDAHLLNRYLPVSVERGWTSKRDLVGYYNPLTKTFDQSSGQIFNALKLLDLEKREGISRFPYLILLDEANLSQMEYYWADFMNICDDLDESSSVNLGENYVFAIPETLHFLATINNDHTTDTLSPRLIDRAFIISLPKAGRTEEGRAVPEEEIRPVSWESLKGVFVSSEGTEGALPEEARKLYESILALFRKSRLTISPRSDLAMRRYMKKAAVLMEPDEYGIDASIVALDYVTAQRILPKIDGYGEGVEAWLRELKNLFANSGLTMSEKIVSDILETGNMQEKYFRFFGR